MQVLNLLSRLILPFLILASMACSERKVQITQHETEQAPAKMSKETLAAEVESKESQKIAAYRQSMGQGEVKRQELLSNLASEVLSEKNLLNPAFVSARSSKQKLQLMNELLLDGASSSDVLAKFVATVSDGCDHKLFGCKNISFFKADALSSKVIQKAAAKETDLRKYYRLLLLAFATKNIAQDSDLDSMYALRSSEFEKLVADQPEVLERHHKILSQILTSQKYVKKDTGWVLSLGGWDVSKKVPSTLSQDHGNLLETLARNHLYVDSSKKVLNPTLLASIQKSQAAEGSFLSRQKHLLSTFPQVSDNLKIKALATENEYFFLVDRIFRESVSLPDITPVYMATGRDLGRLSEVAKQYIESEMAFLITEANSRLAERILKKEALIQEMMTVSMEESRLTYVNAVNFARRSAAVYDLLKLAHQKNGKAMGSEIIDFYEGLRRNLKYSLTFPQMMSLAYYVSKTQFRAQMELSFGPLLLASDSVLVHLFNGVYLPWFDYGHDELRLNAHELYIAFGMALKTRSFETFKINPEDFLFQLFSAVVREKVTRVTVSQAMITSKFSDPSWNTILKICQTLPQEPKILIPVHIDELPTAPLGQLTNKFAISGSGMSKLETLADVSAVKPGFMFYNYTLGKQIERIRLDHRPFFRRARLMTNMLQDYFVSQGLSEESVKVKVERAKAPIVNLQNEEKELVSLVAKYRTQFESCYGEFMEYDKKIQLRVFQYEMEFFRQIYRDMKLIRESKGQVQKLNEKNRFYGIEGFSGYQSFDGEALQNGRADMFLRMKYYFEKGLKTDTVSLPPISPTIQVKVPNDKTESWVLNDQRISRVLWQADENSFVRQGLSEIRDGFVYWYRSTYFDETAKDLRLWVSTSASLYLMGPIEALNKESFEVKVDDLVQIPFRQNQAMGISETEEAWMKSIGVKEKHEMVQLLAPAVVDSRDYRPLSPYDYMFLSLSGDYMGPFDDRENTMITDSGDKLIVSRPAEMISLFEELEAYYQFQQRRDGFMFGIGPGIISSLHQEYQQEMSDYTLRIENLIKAVRSRHEQDLGKNSLLQVSYRLGLRTNGEYVSTHREESLMARIQTFNERTKNAFKK